MVSLLFPSTVLFGSYVQNKNAESEHLCSDAEVREDGSSVTQRLDLCRLTEQEKPAFPAVSSFKWPTQLLSSGTSPWDFFFFFFLNIQYFILPVMLYQFPLPQYPLHHHPGSTTGFSIRLHHPDFAWQSHLQFTAHLPIYFTLHDLGVNNRKGSFTNICNYLSSKVRFSKLRQRAGVMHGQILTAWEDPEHTNQHSMRAQRFLARKSGSVVSWNSNTMRQDSLSIAS